MWYVNTILSENPSYPFSPAGTRTQSYATVYVTCFIKCGNHVFYIISKRKEFLLIFYYSNQILSLPLHT